jgi:uncharacterized LabA/DUF88 family protein
LSGDSDLIPAIEIAKEEGALVRLYHGKKYHRELWELCDERIPLTESLISQIRFAKPA